MPEAEPSVLLQAADLTVWRGDYPLFESVSLHIAAGEILQIEGNNGAGKTTLLKVLCGLVLADEGDVSWRGESCRRNATAFHLETLYLGHKPGLKQELSAIENLRSLVGLRTVLADDSADAALDVRILAALEYLQVAERAELPCNVLSAGQRRRVALARLLLSDARLWILDEPMTALDQEGRDRVQSMMQQHLAQQGAIIYTTHQPLQGFGRRNRTLKLTGAANA